MTNDILRHHYQSEKQFYPKLFQAYSGIKDLFDLGIFLSAYF